MNYSSLITDGNPSLYNACPVISELGQIRTLELFEGLSHEPLKCRLIRTTLPEKDRASGKTPLRYEALSYTWGSAGLIPIIIDGKQGLSVTDNLAAALRRLRLEHRSRMLWVDALCINQNDLTERAGQVKLMGDIFSNATGVLVWLGEVNDNKWMLPVEHDCIVYETVDGGSRLYRTPEQRVQGSIDVSATEMQRCGLHGALHDTKPSWWQRTWVVQEFCKAPANLQICYGAFEETFDDFFSAEGLLWQLAAYNGEDIVCQSFWTAQYRLNDIRTKVRQGPLTIIDFAENCFQAAATDERDKAYSLRSMISVGEAKWIEPDYRVSIKDVFARATFASIVGCGHLGILRFIWQTPTRNTSLPSWTVDFNDAGLLPGEAIRDRIRGASLFQALEPWSVAASYPHIQQPFFDDIANTLSLAGRNYDTIVAVETIESCSLLQSPATTISSAQAKRITSILASTMKLRNARESTFVTNASKTRSRTVLEYVIDLFQDWYKEIGIPGSPTWASDVLTDYAMFSSTEQASQYTIFTTARGLLGLCKGTVEVNDCVVLLHSAPLPALLHKNKGLEGDYSFRGYAAVTDLMGECSAVASEADTSPEAYFAIA